MDLPNSWTNLRSSQELFVIVQYNINVNLLITHVKINSYRYNLHIYSCRTGCTSTQSYTSRR